MLLINFGIQWGVGRIRKSGLIPVRDGAPTEPCGRLPDTALITADVSHSSHRSSKSIEEAGCVKIQVPARIEAGNETTREFPP